jgi:hypothetical protein
MQVLRFWGEGPKVFLPLPLGEGWGEGPKVSERLFYFSFLPGICTSNVSTAAAMNFPA